MGKYTYKRVDRELKHKGAIIDVYTDHMEISNGNKADWDFIGHKGAAAIVAEDENGCILMVRQYRNALDQEILEIPAGGLNKGEDMKTCAMRELEEETGYRTTHAEHLLDLYTTVAFCNEKIGIYYTDELIKSRQKLDEDESVEVLRYPLEELVQMIFDGKIEDGKTISAIMTYKALKERNR